MDLIRPAEEARGGRKAASYAGAATICSEYKLLLDCIINYPNNEDSKRFHRRNMAEAMKCIAKMVEWEE